MRERLIFFSKPIPIQLANFSQTMHIKFEIYKYKYTDLRSVRLSALFKTRFSHCVRQPFAAGDLVQMTALIILGAFRQWISFFLSWR